LGGGRIDWVVDFLDGGISDAVVVMGKRGLRGESERGIGERTNFETD